jgi:ECF sigma factor
MPDPALPVTALLRAWRRGDQEAFRRLTPLVYEELRRRARNYLRGERRNHTLQPTALVNEVYLRMVNIDQVDWHDRTHFIAVAARHMRRILVDSARARRYQKRGAYSIVASSMMRFMKRIVDAGVSVRATVLLFSVIENCLRSKISRDLQVLSWRHLQTRGEVAERLKAAVC